jgi:hypothetical protein
MISFEVKIFCSSKNPLNTKIINTETIEVKDTSTDFIQGILKKSKENETYSVFITELDVKISKSRTHFNILTNSDFKIGKMLDVLVPRHIYDILKNTNKLH